MIDTNQIQVAANSSRRRPVLTVRHSIDADGHVIGTQLEAAPGTTANVAHAAWNAAPRCHPWIIGDELAGRMEITRTIAIEQVRHLMQMADEVLFAIDRAAPVGDLSGEALWRSGFIAATSQLSQGVRYTQKLRDSLMDLRPYMRSLQFKDVLQTATAPTHSTPFFRRS